MITGWLVMSGILFVFLWLVILVLLVEDGESFTKTDWRIAFAAMALSPLVVLWPLSPLALVGYAAYRGFVTHD